MKAISYTAARSNLAKTMESICNDHEPVIITRKNERSVVMLSLEDYEALEETAYLLRSPKNMKRLIESISELEDGKGLVKELNEWISHFLLMRGTIICIGKKQTKTLHNVLIY